MKIVFARQALRDLESIQVYLRAEYPESAVLVERRLSLAFIRINEWPKSGQVVDMPNIRAISLVRYPYKIFYRVTDHIEILAIRHSARQ